MEFRVVNTARKVLEYRNLDSLLRGLFTERKVTKIMLIRVKGRCPGL
jgi:hypothetical protein